MQNDPNTPFGQQTGQTGGVPGSNGYQTTGFPAPGYQPDSEPEQAADSALQTDADTARDEAVADRDEQVRARAYEIWEEEGRPEGHDEEHWYRAQAEID